MKKNAKISLAVVLCLVVSMFAGCLTGFAATPDAEKVEKYADVGEGHWAYPWVTFMTDNGYIHGYPAGENDGQELYKPDQLITRAEFVTILYYMLNPTANMSESFTDLGVDDWYYEFINKAVGTGYMSGYGDGTVKPNAFITREEATSVVYRAFKIDKYTNATSFADEAQISDWAYEAIMSLAELGIVVGYTGADETLSSIQPKVNIKRAEVASLLANADKFYPTSVRYSATARAELTDNGGVLAFDASPKNTSDQLTVEISVEPDTTFTVTYTKNGSSVTVTPDEFKDVVFTADELKNADIKVNFPNAKEGDKLTVTVKTFDAEYADNDHLVGETSYVIEFSAEEPTPTPTTSPTVTPIGGGGNTVSYLVTYYLDTTPAPTKLGEENVASGRTANFPDPTDNTKAYVWYTDEACTVRADVTAGITAATRFYAKLERDRVVESLVAYQATKDKAATDATDKNADIKADPDTMEKDMIKIIVTNDNNALGDGAGYDDITASSPMMDTYRDVARFVVKNSTAFSDATIKSSTKFVYVKYFRAMIKTVNAAADKAIAEYKSALADATGEDRKQAAYNAFLIGAATGANSAIDAAMTDESLPDTLKSDIKNMAKNYVGQILLAATGKTTEAEALAELKTMLEAKDPTSATFDAEVKAMISANTLFNVTEQ